MIAVSSPVIPSSDDCHVNVLNISSGSSTIPGLSISINPELRVNHVVNQPSLPSQAVRFDGPWINDCPLPNPPIALMESPGRTYGFTANVGNHANSSGGLPRPTMPLRLLHTIP